MIVGYFHYSVIDDSGVVGWVGSGLHKVVDKRDMRL